jgi:hypothetical protein
MGTLSSLFYGAIALSGAYVAWTSYEQDRGYPVTVDQAEERLDSMDFSQSMLIGFNAKRTRENSADGSRQLRWTFSRRGKSGGATASCVALLTPIAPQQTETQFDCAPDGTRGDMELARAGAGLIKVLFEEHFNAALEGRKTSGATFGRAAASYAVTLQPLMAKRLQRP